MIVVFVLAIMSFPSELMMRSICCITGKKMLHMNGDLEKSQIIRPKPNAY